ncbi:MAG TPA: glycosyltransferase family 2 protein [Fibrobacteria bacterium]|nr:glycosyltransferase family 2 protein [Fibrobacteria bacterium]
MTESAFRPGHIGIVIVAYNDFPLLERCIASILESSYRSVEIIVVDNSTLEDVRTGLAAYPAVHYRRMAENLGFCGANNVGFRISWELGTRYTLMLNHDARLSRETLGILAERAAGLKDLGILTGKIYFTGGKRLWYAGGYFDRLIGAGKNLGFNETDRGQFDAFREVQYATGCFMLIPNPVFRRAGLLDERFFMYLDDIEFCLRVRKAGLRIYYEPKAAIEHDLGSGSHLPLRPDYYLYFSIRNKPLVLRGEAYTLYLYFAAAAVAAVKLAQFTLHPGIPDRGAKMRAILWGLIDAFSGEARYRRRFPRLFRRG